MSKQINPFHSEHSENRTRGTDRWYSGAGKVSAKDVAENTSGNVGNDEPRGSHFPLDLSSSHNLRKHIEKEMDETSV